MTKNQNLIWWIMISSKIMVLSVLVQPTWTQGCSCMHSRRNKKWRSLRSRKRKGKWRKSMQNQRFLRSQCRWLREREISLKMGPARVMDSFNNPSSNKFQLTIMINNYARKIFLTMTLSSAKNYKHHKVKIVRRLIKENFGVTSLHNISILRTREQQLQVLSCKKIIL